MINIQISGADKVAEDFKRMATVLPIQAESMLDKAASETEGKMKEESPRASGEMTDSIKTIIPESGVRVIGPGVDYAYYQNNRDWMSQRMPPKEKILQWARAKGFTDTGWGGGESQMAFLIARKIQLRGYPSNRFVLRTFEWLATQIEVLLGSFLSAVVSGVGGGL